MTARWQFWPEDSSPYSTPRLACYDGKTSDIKLGDVTDEQGEVMTDALNVHEATGLTPSQLQARVAELEGALRAVVEESRWGDTEECRALIAEIKKAEGVLNRV